jgi:hypothetical protein
LIVGSVEMSNKNPVDAARKFSATSFSFWLDIVDDAVVDKVDVDEIVVEAVDEFVDEIVGEVVDEFVDGIVVKVVDEFVDRIDGKVVDEFVNKVVDDELGFLVGRFKRRLFTSCSHKNKNNYWLKIKNV